MIIIPTLPASIIVRRSVGFRSAFAATTSTVSLGTPTVGDLIVLWAERHVDSTPIEVPTAGGTVPNWNIITSATNASMSWVVAYTFATSNSNTSGTWANANRTLRASFFNADTSTPIGGTVFTTFTSSQPMIIPAISSLTDSSGSSQIIKTAQWNSADPIGYISGYELRAGGTSGSHYAATKNSTTVDAALNTGITSNRAFVSSVEILGAPA